jgi:hypothetical protein
MEAWVVGVTPLAREAMTPCIVPNREVEALSALFIIFIVLLAVYPVIANAGKQTAVPARLRSEDEQIRLEIKAKIPCEAQQARAFERCLKAHALKLTNEAEAAAENVEAKVVNEARRAGSGIPAELRKVL